MINNCSDLALPVDSTPESATITSMTNYGRTPTGKGPVEIETMYINNLPCDVIVVDRTGFRHRVPKVIRGFDGKFIIRTMYTITEAAYSDCKHLFAGFRGSYSKDLDLIKKAIAYNDQSHRPLKSLVIGIDHSVRMEDFDSSGSSLFIKDSDVVVSCLSFEEAPAHPRAMGTVSEEFFMKTLGSTRVGFSLGVGIEMVNRAPGAQCMYTFVMQSIKKIPVSQDKQREEGFYVTVLDKDLCTPNDQKLVTMHYPLDKASELGIYKSEEETKASGDIKLLWEREISILKHDSEVLRIKLGNDKLQADQEATRLSREHETAMFAVKEAAAKEALRMAEELRVSKQYSETQDRIHEEKLRRAKEEAAEASRAHEKWLQGFAVANEEREKAHKERMQSIEKEKEGLKDYYEKRSYQRKDFSDALKIILATITTMGVLIVTYNKTFGKEPIK
jgi:hypothetical protein